MQLSIVKSKLQIYLGYVLSLSLLPTGSLASQYNSTHLSKSNAILAKKILYPLPTNNRHYRREAYLYIHPTTNISYDIAVPSLQSFLHLLLMCIKICKKDVSSFLYTYLFSKDYIIFRGQNINFNPKEKSTLTKFTIITQECSAKCQPQNLLVQDKKKK